MSTKIHALVDGLGNPLAFHLTPAQHHDLAGADVLIPQIQADLLMADRADDADARVIDRLQAMGKRAVIKPKKNRKHPRPHDKALYAARHLIENFFCRLKQFRAIATRYDKRARIFLAAITPQQPSSGSFEDTPTSDGGRIRSPPWGRRRAPIRPRRAPPAPAPYHPRG